MITPTKVRFAPSPTGPLHIGGVRTALYNYLFAKANKGTFILRIEDTDTTRSNLQSETYLKESLKWLGIIPKNLTQQGQNSDPLKQSERLPIYKTYIEQLIKNNKLYYAFDTQTSLDKIRQDYIQKKKTFAYNIETRKHLNNSLTLSTKQVKENLQNKIPFTLRFKIPEGQQLQLNDIIKGNILINTSDLDDKILVKQDGMPTYHLANVIDDHLMQISHVIRGEEWLTSLPLHILIYKALGWGESIPKFAHLPLILKENGEGKLSKRDSIEGNFPIIPLPYKDKENNFLLNFKEQGIEPEVLLNAIALLGWNPGTTQEIFSLKELEKTFSLKNITKSNARFSPKKIEWFNQQYYNKKSVEDITNLFTLFLSKKNITVEENYLKQIVTLTKKQTNSLQKLWEQTSYFFKEPEEYSTKDINKLWQKDTSYNLKICTDILKSILPFKKESIEIRLKALIRDNNMPFINLLGPIRIALTGAVKGPSLFDILEILGKKESIIRIEKILQIKQITKL